MSYVSLTKSGVIRGPHEHKFQADCFVFVGAGDFELYLWDNRQNSSTYRESLKLSVGENNPTMVIVPAGVVHGYKCVSENSAMSFNFPDKLYRGENKQEDIDEIRWEKDANSPFKII